MKRLLPIAITVLLAASGHAQIRVERNIPVGQIVPDQGQYVSSVVLPNPGMTNIFDVRVSLFLSSPDVANLMWLGDMYASLTHGTASENERVAVLLNRPGRSTADEWGSDLSSLAVTFDDSGAAPNVFSTSSPTGVYRADGRLSVNPYGSPVTFSAGNAGLDALDGPWLASNRWSLLVADTEAGGQGRLDGWKLTITGFGAPTGTLDPGAGGTITDVAGATNTVGAVVNVGSGTGTNGVTTTVSNTMTFDGGISGSGDMVKSGAGTLMLSGASTNFSGVVRVNEGKLEIATSNAVGNGSVALQGTNVQMRVGNGVQFSAPIDISTNGANLLGSGILAGAISGQGRITKTDADSTLVLSGSNSFTGGTTINNGALRLANSHAAGLGGVIVAQGARLELSNAIVISNTIDATGQISFVSSGNVLSGTITNNNTVYNVAAGTTNTVSAFITGVGGLELIGGGVLQVTGTTNDYQSATTISNGTLRVSTLGDAGTPSSIGIDNSIVLAGSTAASAVLQYTNTADVSMNRAVTLTNNGGGTIDVTQSEATVTLSGSMGNASGTTNVFVKSGAGEIVLNNSSVSNNFSASAIQVNAGTLTLGAANQIGDGTDLILNGGTFRTGNASAGYAESLGDLTLNASSTIDLGSAAGLRDLIFLDSNGVAWAGGATLTVANWAGTISGGTAGRIFFGSNSSGLGAGQLSQITFSGYSAGAQILGTGEIVPLNLTAAVPEPGTYAAAAILVLLAFWHRRRRGRNQAATA
jgi:autotransporter-associated beta strand protein